MTLIDSDETSMAPFEPGEMALHVSITHADEAAKLSYTCLDSTRAVQVDGVRISNKIERTTPCRQNDLSGMSFTQSFLGCALRYHLISGLLDEIRESPAGLLPIVRITISKPPAQVFPVFLDCGCRPCG